MVYYGSGLRHGKYVNDTHGIVVDKLAQHETHDLHWHTSSTVFQHLIFS